MGGEASAQQRSTGGRGRVGRLLYQRLSARRGSQLFHSGAVLHQQSRLAADPLVSATCSGDCPSFAPGSDRCHDRFHLQPRAMLSQGLTSGAERAAARSGVFEAIRSVFELPQVGVMVRR